MKNFNELEKFESNEIDEEESRGENKEAKIIKFELDREWNESEKHAIKIVEKIGENGSEAYFAGGVVRDYILNREPNDIDISTSASLEELEEIFGDDCFYVSPKAEEHGVLSVVIDDEIFEVAVFRKEIFQDNKDGIKEDLEDDVDSESEENLDKKAKKKKQKQIDGRQADKVELENISAEEDAQRRDLTMNGMFYDPLKEEIIDYVGGCEDIENEIVRFIGDPKERIEEDKIRIIRFFRFKGVLGFDAEKESLDTIKDWLSDEDNRKKFKELFCLDQRIKHEFEKIIKSDSRVEILEDLMKCGALELMFPQIAKMKGVEQPKEFHEEGDVWEHTKKCLENLPKDASLELIWAVLLHDTGKPETQETPEKDGTDRIRFNGHEKKSIKIATYILSIEKEPKKYKKQG
ncbi:CCA tRNA nucleotidyltransferase, partial [Candidatus Parcubacteria bacterium]|nr:CCA tRNA nucleotidyltransferase [Candidatus Parcubacteria bacterium]